jgi:hypothetical protein
LPTGRYWPFPAYDIRVNADLIGHCQIELEPKHLRILIFSAIFASLRWMLFGFIRVYLRSSVVSIVVAPTGENQLTTPIFNGTNSWSPRPSSSLFFFARRDAQGFIEDDFAHLFDRRLAIEDDAAVGKHCHS